ncbi:MAG: MBL fold metallo-hydrolase [Propionibacteriaceae bacterium]|nr:MBL fold metallo-hydrolase [Propionibacteriaceae bacterium]
MRITHLGHAAVLVEAAGRRVLIDPGNFSSDWHGLSGLDAVCITHQHPDHVDPDHLPRLLDANPSARVWVEADVHLTCQHERMEPLGAGERRGLGELTIAAHGGRHAVIHADIPRIGNIGLTFEAPGEPVFFHPGDSLEAVPAGVDVLAIPIYGPWAAMKETIDFVRAVGAPLGFPIHEGLLNERGWSLIFGRLNSMTATRTRDLRSGEAWAPQLS